MTPLQLLQSRHSVRRYSDRAIASELISALQATITDINTHEAGMRFQLMLDDPEPFKGFGRSYGFFKGVRNYVAAVVDTTYANYRERGGYCGMRVVMKATELGLGTCFVGGTYSGAHVGARVRVGEKILFLITVGYEQAGEPGLLAGLSHKFIHRKKLSSKSFLESEIPLTEIRHTIPAIDDALAAVACAPSALNKRPARLIVKQTGSEMQLQMRVPEGNEGFETDLGIALYSVATIIPGVWEWGNPATLLPY